MPPDSMQAGPTSAASESSPVNKYALIIGVNAYPDSKTSKKPIGDLGGCVNDAMLIKSVLRDKFGVPESGIRFLASPAPEGRPENLATRANILAGFEELIEKADSDDMVVVYFAGHGSRVKDRDLDEGSGMDSSILPCDAIRWSSKDEFVTDEVIDVTDDEVHVKLLRLAKKTDNVTLIFDSCHSGTMSRGPGDPHMVARQAPEDERPADQLQPIPYTDEERALLAESRKRNASGWASPMGKYVMISGCRDSEFSYETEVPGTQGGETVTHGALTYYLVEALRSAKPGDTYRDVFERLAPKVMANNASQHPQIDGAQDREIFGTREIEPLAFVRVVDVQGSKVTLDGGAAHGLTVGSVWTVHPQGTRVTTDENRTGEVKITDVRATKSFAEIVGGSEPEAGAVQAHQWAVEKERDYGDRRMRVRLLGDPNTDRAAWEALETGLQGLKSRVERIEDDSAAAVKVVLVAARENVDPDDPAPQVGPLRAPAVAVINESGDLMMPPKPASTAGIRDALDNLDRWAQYRYKLAIDNPGSGLAEQVSFEILHRTASTEPWAPLRARQGESLPAVQTGDLVKFRLINQGPGEVYCGLLDFLIDGSVQVLHKGWLQERRPEQPHLELQGSDEGSEITWEGGFPFDPNPYVESPTEGVEVLKLFLTKQETNFEALAQESASRSASPAGNPLEELLADPGGATRGVKLNRIDDWGTVSFPFILRAPSEAEVQPEKPPVSLGGFEVSAAGLTGKARLGGKVDVGGVERPPPYAEDSPAARLRRLLEEQGLYPKESLNFGDAAPAGTGGSRGAGDGPGALTITTEDSDPDWGEVLLSSDDAGIVHWHLPVEDSAPEPGSRAGPGQAASPARGPRKRTYRIDPPTEDEASPRTRGPLAAAVGRVFVDRIAFPLLGPIAGAALGAWESRFAGNRVRWFGPGDLDSDDVREVSGEDWKRLGEGRTLLFLHGPFSRAHRAFRDLTPEVLAQLRDRYRGRIIALDHMTLSQDPNENVQWLVDQLPPEIELELDVIGHSRGGLVGRVLAEKASELTREGREIRVGRLILVGSPSAGSALADPAHVESALSVLTNLFSAFDPTVVAGPIVQLVQKLATGTAGELSGIAAMVPGGPFLRSLGSPADNETQYYGVASDIASAGSDKFSRTLFERMVRKVLGDGPNDLFVPAASVWGGGDGELPFAEKRTLTGSDARSHLGYFDVAAVQRDIVTWLGREGPPITVESGQTAEAPVGMPSAAQPTPAVPEPTTAQGTPAAAADAVDSEDEEASPELARADQEPPAPRQRVNGGEAGPEPAVRRWGLESGAGREPLVPPRLPGHRSGDPPHPPGGRRGTDPPSPPGGRH